MDTNQRKGRHLITRRHMLAAAAGSSILLPDALGSALTKAALAQSKGPLVFMTWSGNFGKGVRTAFSDPFTKATGIEVIDVTPFNYGKFQTAMQNKNPENYCLVWFNDEMEPARAGKDGLLEKLNYDWLPKSKKAIPSAKQDYAVAPYITVYQVGYRSDTYKDKPPASWKDFWDVQQFPGPRSIGSWVGGVLEAALMADGVAPDKLYPLDEDRAFKMLDRIKPHIRVFHDTQSSQNVRQMLLQNELSMVFTWSTDFIAAKLAGRPIDVIYNGGFYFSPSVGIAKGHKLAREAHQYLDLFFDEEAELNFIKAWPTSPAVPEVIEKMPENVRKAAAISHIKSMVHFNRDYYLEHQPRLQQRYDRWRIG